MTLCARRSSACRRPLPRAPGPACLVGCGQQVWQYQGQKGQVPHKVLGGTNLRGRAGGRACEVGVGWVGRHAGGCCGAGCGAGCGWVLRCWLWCRLWARAVWCWLWCRLWASSAGLPTAAPARRPRPAHPHQQAARHLTPPPAPTHPAPTLLKATNSMVCSSRQKGRSPAQRHPTAPCSAACALLNTLRGGGPGAELSPCSATWFPGGSRAAEPQRAPPHQRPASPAHARGGGAAAAG